MEREEKKTTCVIFWIRFRLVCLRLRERWLCTDLVLNGRQWLFWQRDVWF